MGFWRIFQIWEFRQNIINGLSQNIGWASFVSPTPDFRAVLGNLAPGLECGAEIAHEQVCYFCTPKQAPGRHKRAVYIVRHEVYDVNGQNTL